MKNIFKSGTQTSQNPYVFALSSEVVDRDGDIITLSGLDLKNFKKNPIALYQHNQNTPIGTWENVKVIGKKLVGTLKLAEQGTSKHIDTIRKLVEQRILKAISIGFSVQEHQPLKNGGYKFTKSSLLEASLVSVPANQDALRLSKSLNLSDDDISTFFVDGGPTSAHHKPEKKKLAPQSGTKNNSLKPKSKGKKMSIAAKIVSKQNTINASKAKLDTINKKFKDDENYELTEAENTEVELLTEEIDIQSKALDNLLALEKSISTKSTPPSARKIDAKPKDEKAGDLLVKMAVTNFIAHCQNKNVLDVVKERYADDSRVDAIIKTAVSTADTTTAGWAAELVGSDIQGFMDHLKPYSIYASLAAKGTSITFGNNGSVTIPRRAGSNTDIAGAFVGENGVIPVKRTTLASDTLWPYKMGVISTFTKELARSSNPHIETIIRKAMIDDTANALDNALLDTEAAVTGVRPASITNGVTGQISAGDTAADIITDLKFLINALSSKNAGMAAVLIMNPARVLGLSTVTTATGGFLFRDEIAQSRVLGLPFISSTNCPADQVIILDAAYFATAFGMPQIDVSDTATLTMANSDGTAPTQATDGSGALGTAEQVLPGSGISVVGGESGAATAGYQAQSMFQVWAVAVRNVMPVSWAMTRADLVERVTGVSW